MTTNSYDLYPYLNFDGRCEEAIEFYKKAIDAVPLMVMRFKDAPPEAKAQQCGPAPAENKIMHARLRAGNGSLMLSDGRCTNAAKFEGISLSLNVATTADAERYFKALSEGGNVLMPLAKTFFSPAFGMVADKFGIMWMVHVETAR